MTIGIKFDDEKPRLSLLPWSALDEVAIVLMFGAVKYDVDNWKEIDDGERRYIDAAFRHLAHAANGDGDDPESGLPHLAHAACCTLFALWFYTRRTGESDASVVRSALDKARKLREARKAASP